MFLGRVWPNPDDSREPYWLPDDADKAIASELAENEVCPRCGYRDEDFIDEEGDPHDPPLYEPVLVRCEGCRAKARLTQSVEDQARRDGAGDAGMASRMLAGHFVTIRRFDPSRPITPVD